MTDAPAVAQHRETTYDHALFGIRGWWRGLVAIISLVVGFLLVSLILGLIAVVIDLATGRSTLESLATGKVEMTPSLMLFNNLSIAAMIPLSMLLQRWLFGVRFRSLFSLENRFRWRWMSQLALIVVPVWALYIGLGFVLDPGGSFRVDTEAILLIVIVLATTPFQAAGEEFGARGLIQRSAQSWIRNPRVSFIVGTAISATLFCLAHFAADLWLISYYLVFGISMSLVARGTGGLEAPVLIHAINNVLVFIPVILSGRLSESMNRDAGVGDPTMLISMAVCIGVALFTIWWAKRRGVTVVAPAPKTVAQEKYEAWLAQQPPAPEVSQPTP